MDVLQSIKDKRIGFVYMNAAVFSLVTPARILHDYCDVKFVLPNKKFFMLYDDNYKNSVLNILTDNTIIPYDYIKDIEIVTLDDLSDGSLDLLIFLNPTYLYYMGFTVTEMKAISAKLGYFPYATEFLGFGYDHWLISQQYMDDVDILFASSPYAKYHYTCCKGDMEKLYCVGNPELDIIYNKLYENGAIAKVMKEFIAGDFTFLYTPHWTSYSEPYWSSWLLWATAIYAFFRTRKNYKLILRPHPFVFLDAPNIPVKLRMKIFELLNMVTALPNVFLDRSASSIPAIALSDALISDCSSIIQKFWATGKPIIVSDVRYGAAQDAIDRCLEVIDSPEDLTAAMLRLAAGEDPLKEARLAESMSFCGPFDGQCGQRMTNVLASFLADK